MGPQLAFHAATQAWAPAPSSLQHLPQPEHLGLQGGLGSAQGSVAPTSPSRRGASGEEALESAGGPWLQVELGPDRSSLLRHGASPSPGPASPGLG